MTANEIYTQVLIIEQRLEDKIKSHSKNWYWLIAVGTAIILFIVLFFTVFKKQKPTDEAYKIEIQKLDEKLMRAEGKIENLEEVNQQQDSVIRHQNEAYQRNRPIEIRLNKEHDKIPIDVRNLDKLNLRREVATFPE